MGGGVYWGHCNTGAQGPRGFRATRVTLSERPDYPGPVEQAGCRGVGTCLRTACSKPYTTQYCIPFRYHSCGLCGTWIETSLLQCSFGVTVLCSSDLTPQHAPSLDRECMIAPAFWHLLFRWAAVVATATSGRYAAVLPCCVAPCWKRSKAPLLHAVPGDLQAKHQTTAAHLSRTQQRKAQRIRPRSDPRIVPMCILTGIGQSHRVFVCVCGQISQVFWGKEVRVPDSCCARG